jgi:hypothetical protein
MKRAVTMLVAAGLILGSVSAALAQAPAGPTVSFGGQMRVYGFVSNNMQDFKDSQDNGASRDSNSFWFQRFRLFTTIESADKKARAYWAMEIGDIFWGNGGGASGGNFVGDTGQTAPGQVNVANPAVPATNRPVTATSPTNRVGNSSGGGLGADGVNVETKNLYLWLDTAEWVPGSSVLLGIHNIVFLTTPAGAFMDDDGAGVQLNFKFDPVDLQLYTVKVAENNIANADDIDMYVGRFGFNITKDMRATLEGMVVNQNTGISGVDFGDNFWVGASFGAKFGTVNLDIAGIYGQKQFPATVGTGHFEESGYGIIAVVRAPVGPVNVWGVGWYTSGDDTPGRGPANCNGPGTNSGCGAAGTLTQDSDKLPLPIQGASWINAGAPFIGEGLFGYQTIGGPGPGGSTAVQYADVSGTYGIGGSGTFALTPTFSVGGGVTYVAASGDAQGPYGDWAFDIDGGAIWRFNQNVTITGIGSYIIPDAGDAGWQLTFRSQFSF